ncbi:MAG: YmdB family metallophosphoesterase [Akkermansiaceae bacterium]|nr:YmdB family metallophosphoesterase [Akkermansiaceae bacterium]
MTRDLAADPAWEEKDLGASLPDSLHACSVCLPTWDSIIGYEEGREKVLKRMRTGYPRFFKHPAVERLFDNAKLRSLEITKKSSYCPRASRCSVLIAGSSDKQ